MHGIFGRTVSAWGIAVVVAPAAAATLASIDLARAFGTRSAWRLTATQGPTEPDPIYDGETVPGAIALCLSRDAGRTCDADLRRALHGPDGDDLFDRPHFLWRAAVVHPGPGLTLLLVQQASLHSGDGDQRVATQLFAYDRPRDRFHTVYERRVGHNNNQEVRYIDAGSMRGAVVAAEPTERAPFGYWITVDRLTPALTYRTALRYRSATRYNDGNPLAVIDAEMPTIEQRLGLWRPGQPLPVPARCATPRLARGALWCS